MLGGYDKKTGGGGQNDFLMALLCFFLAQLTSTNLGMASNHQPVMILQLFVLVFVWCFAESQHVIDTFEEELNESLESTMATHFGVIRHVIYFPSTRFGRH